MKPGYKTTEFWLTLVTTLITILGALQQVLPAKYAALSVSLVAGLYSVSRGIAKIGPAMGSFLEELSLVSFGDAPEPPMPAQPPTPPRVMPPPPAV